MSDISRKTRYNARLRLLDERDAALAELATARDAHRIEIERLEAQLNNVLKERDQLALGRIQELEAQLENLLDEHAEGTWQSRALDAERERDRAMVALAAALKGGT